MPVSVVCDSSAVTAAIRDSLATSASNGGCSKSGDDSQTLQNKLVASAKRVLLTKIEYEEVNNYSQAVLDTLKSKYIVLKPSGSGKLNHSAATGDVNNKDANHSTPSGPRDPNQLPQPKKILFPRQNVQIGWKSFGRKWQVGAGMMNVGNTCYLNSTLQALFHVPAMANWLMSDSAHREKCEDENGSQGGCIICAMSRTLISSQTSQSHIRPYLVYTKLRLVCKHLIMGRQEDAHEFLRYLVEAMEKSYLARFRNSKELDQYSKETTPLNQILGGYLKSAVRCLACGHVSTTFQHFQDLLLDIRKANTIEEALDLYFARERLEDMGYKCEACKKKVSATKQFSLERAPISLCIQLKRFSMMGSKLNKHVAIRPRLDLSPYASKTNKENLTYKLVAMVTHLGASQHCGHYTAIGLTDTGTYYQFDDSYVRSISLQNVLNTNAYIIFYELDDSHENRQTSTQVSRGSNENSLKDSGSKLNFQTGSNENSFQRQNSATSSTNNGNSMSLNSKIISKLEANQQVTLIGPQLPNKMIQRNPPSSTVATSSESTSIVNGGIKLVSSPSNTKLTNGYVSNTASSNGFQSPSNQKGNNQPLNSKLMIHFKNGNSSTNSKSNSINSNNNKLQSPDGSKFQTNSSKTADRFEYNRSSSYDREQSNGNRSTLPSMPKLEESSPKEKSSSPPSGSNNLQTASKSNGIDKPTTNGFVKSPVTGSSSKNNIKSLVPYESDDESDQSNDELPTDKDCTPSTTFKSNQKRSYESDNESTSSSSSSDCTPPPPKISLTPPSTPIVKTKAGLWQVTDIAETKSKNSNHNTNAGSSTSCNGDWKNPFSSATPSTFSGNYMKSNDKFNEKDKKFNKKTNESDNGKSPNGTVQHLLKFSHRGYGAPVLSWNGQKPTIEKEVIEEIRQERKRDLQDEEENDMDRGRQKKVKCNNGFVGRDNPGYNPFQEHQNHQNQHRRWNSGSYRPYRPNNHHRNHNFRRHNFHKKPHHQRNGGGSNGFHHRRDS